MRKRKILYRRIMQKFALVQYSGNFREWIDASKLCVGYDAENIFDKVKSAALRVKAGEACYERDSCLFYEKAFNYPLVAHLEKIAMENDNYLDVIDWGGALGSTYYQNRKLLCSEKLNYKWSVVEQVHFVKYGKENLTDEILKFIDIEDVQVKQI